MTLNEFVNAFAREFDDTPLEEFAPNTIFKELNEWSSLTALSIIAMVDEQMDKRISGADIRSNNTIEDLFNTIMAK